MARLAGASRDASSAVRRGSSKPAPKRSAKRLNSSRQGRETEAAVGKAKRAVAATRRAAKAHSTTKGDSSGTTAIRRAVTVAKASRALRRKRTKSGNGTNARAERSPTKMQARPPTEEEDAVTTAPVSGNQGLPSERDGNDAVPPPVPTPPTTRSPFQKEVQNLMSHINAAVSAEPGASGECGDRTVGVEGDDAPEANQGVDVDLNGEERDNLALRTRLGKSLHALQMARDSLDAADRAKRAAEKETMVLRGQLVTQVRRCAHLETLLEEERAKRLAAEETMETARSEASQAARAAAEAVRFAARGSPRRDGPRRGSPRRGSPRKGRSASAAQASRQFATPKEAAAASREAAVRTAEVVTPGSRSGVHASGAEAEGPGCRRRDPVSSHAAESFTRKLGDLRESQSMLELQLERLKAVLDR